MTYSPNMLIRVSVKQKCFQ